MTNAEARFNKSLQPRKPEGSLGQTAQDVHLDSHTAPELCFHALSCFVFVLFSCFFFAGVAGARSGMNSKSSQLCGTGK